MVNIFFCQMIYTVYKQQRKIIKIQHKLQHIKLKNITTKPYVLFNNAIRLSKNKRNYKKRILISQPKIYNRLTRM